MQSNNEKISDVANKICESLNIGMEEISKARSVKMKIQNIRKTRWHEKPNHGYFEKSRNEKLNNIDYKLSWAWMESNSLSSQVEGYIITLQDQEIYTKTTRKHHEKNPIKKQEIETRCRMCKQENETLQHILDCCPAISSNLYLQDRHNPIAKIVYDQILDNYGIENKSNPPLSILTTTDCDIWWDEKIKVPNAVKHNKPDIILWDKKQKLCKIIDISAPLDINIEKKYQEKINNYIHLVSELERTYREYRFEIIPVIIGALGTINNKLTRSLEQLDVEKENINRTIKKMQQRCLIGSLKIVRTFMNIKE